MHVEFQPFQDRNSVTLWESSLIQRVLLATIVLADGGIVLDVYIMLVQTIVQVAQFQLVYVLVGECIADNIASENKVATLALCDVLYL